jgi:hypothetical protein
MDKGYNYEEVRAILRALLHTFAVAARRRRRLHVKQASVRGAG